MLNIDNRGYITKNQTGEDQFDSFHKEGIELLQKLSGSIWTDFNEHDPGVTILENLIYALTELNYKASLPVKDLLIQPDGVQLNSGQGGLYIASDILTTNPVTLIDYRKLFIDSISNVKNVWIIYKSVDTDNYRSFKNCKGLYHVYVELYEYKSTEKEARVEKKRIEKELRTLYNAHRNLCEHLCQITIYKPLRLEMRYDISLNNDTEAENIAARILFEINAYLTSDIRYYSLWELQNAGTSVEDIFNGPHLQNGFIPDSCLGDRIKKIVLTDLVKLISRIEGVSRVHSFQMNCQNSNEITGLVITEEAISIPDDYSPVLSFPENNNNLIFENNGIKYRPDLDEVKNILMDFRSIEYRSFKTVSKAMNEINIPEGSYLDVDSYLSVRHQFPAVYGIGDIGLPGSLPAKRHAQANQLKAYLLPLDQLMANYLEQLAQFQTLYDATNNQTSSYFYQRLADMDKLSQLISIKESDQDLLMEWDATMEHLTSKLDKDSIKRLNQISDNILARFGEEFNTYFLKKTNDICYKNEFPDDFESHLLSWKRKLIWHYGKISYNRAKAYDYSKIKNEIKEEDESEEMADENNNLTPGLIHKISILMGIDSCIVRPLTKVLEDADINIHHLKKSVKINTGEHDFIFFNNNIEFFEVEEIQISPNTIIDNDYFVTEGKHSILKRVLRNGVLRSNYKIEQAHHQDKDVFKLSFEGDKNISMLHITDSKEEAENALEALVTRLYELNQASEGIFLLEHILLMPPYEEKYFGFRINLTSLNKAIDTFFIPKELQPMKDRNADVALISKQLLTSNGLVFAVANYKNEFEVSISDSSGKILAVSEKKYSNRKECEQLLGYLKSLSSTTNSFPVSEITFFSYFKIHSHHHKYHHHHHYHWHHHHDYHYYGVDETFFSFRMSFILPDWPVRFQNTNFRNKFESLLSEQAPAHLASALYWQDIVKMKEFEGLYYKFIDCLSKNVSVETRMEYSYKLISLLESYKTDF